MRAHEAPLVLVVEDDPDSRQLVERILQRQGYRTVAAEDAHAAVRAVRANRPSLILTDVCMPGMDGYDLCAGLNERLGANCPPVAFVTASDDEQNKQRAFAAGGVDFLSKPVRREALLALVERHIATGDSWRQVTGAARWEDTSYRQRFGEFVRRLLERAPGVVSAAADLLATNPSDVYSLVPRLRVTEQELAREMAAFFQTDYLPVVEPERIQLGVLPRAYSQTKCVVPVRLPNGEELFVTSNPFTWGVDELDVLTNACHGKRRRLAITHQTALRDYFAAPAVAAGQELAGELTISLPGPPAAVETPEELATLLPNPKSATATQIASAMITGAVALGASDIHLQPLKDRVTIRYRIDGHLRPVVELEPSQLASLVARVKILGGMDIAESRKPQDGRCVAQVDGNDVELRVSTLPMTHGEKIVLRVLAQSTALRSLDALDFEADTLQRLYRVLSAKQGMILITGPTGSGKTTVLYAALAHLNRPETNILTVEDPVEMDLPNVGQVQVLDRAGRTFAAALRSMLRQDPDVIMVGEMRDLETAEIACRAALTGHLVLSTLHTQSALGTLTRLFDMGIAPYLASACVNAVMAQRLLRRVCANCGQDYDPPSTLLRRLEDRFGSRPDARFRAGRGCAQCLGTGQKGRVAVVELLVMNDELRSQIVAGATPAGLRPKAMELGFRTMEEDAFLKACRGLIPPEEVFAVGTEV